MDLSWPPDHEYACFTLPRLKLEIFHMRVIYPSVRTNSTLFVRLIDNNPASSPLPSKGMLLGAFVRDMPSIESLSFLLCSITVCGIYVCSGSKQYGGVRSGKCANTGSSLNRIVSQWNHPQCCRCHHRGRSYRSCSIQRCFLLLKGLRIL